MMHAIKVPLHMLPLMYPPQDPMHMLSSIMIEIEGKRKSNLTTPLEDRMTAMFNKLYNVGNHVSSCTVGKWKKVNTQASSVLTLADFKAALEYNTELAQKIVSYLELQPNVDQINQHFPCEERIRAVSYTILNPIRLDDLQDTGAFITAVNSATWYALAPDEQFLNRPISDMFYFRSKTEVVAARIREMAEKNSEWRRCLNEKPSSGMCRGEELDLTIGQLCRLSGQELESMASKLPISACRLFSDTQIQSIDFKFFSGEQLDVMLGGDETVEEFLRRLHLLSPVQKEVFEKNTSGIHFEKYPDSFFETLSLLKFSKEQIENLFGSNYRSKKDEMRRLLRLVPPEEIFKGLHLLLPYQLPLLSSRQIASLDYSKITHEQIEYIFLGWQLDREKKQNISSIPVTVVNDVLKTNSGILPFLSAPQIAKLDVDLLNKEFVGILLPGFAIDSLYPGYRHTINVPDIKAYHTFSDPHSEKGYWYPQDILDTLIEGRKMRCIEVIEAMTSEQLEKTKPLMYPEVRGLLTNNS
jgi:hypothetical protein